MFGIFLGYNYLYANPICTCLAIMSVLPQARETLRLGTPQALSLRTLLLQTMIFPMVAFSWAKRLQVHEIWDMPTERNRIRSWYELVGWAATDNAVFALVQCILLLIAMRAGSGDTTMKQAADVATPLLG